MEWIVRFKRIPGFSQKVEADTRWEAVSKVAKSQGWDTVAQAVVLFKDASVRDAKKEALIKDMKSFKEMVGVVKKDRVRKVN